MKDRVILWASVLLTILGVAVHVQAGSSFISGVGSFQVAYEVGASINLTSVGGIAITNTVPQAATLLTATQDAGRTETTALFTRTSNGNNPSLTVANGTIICNGTGSNSERFGGGSTADGTNGNAFGEQAAANTTDSTAVGYLATANVATETTAVGANALANSTGSTAIGSEAQATTAASATAVGYLSRATAINTIAVGRNATATTGLSTVVGVDSTGSGATNSTTVGAASTNPATNAIIIGGQSALNAASNRAVLVGDTASMSAAGTDECVAVGYGTSITATRGVAVGGTASVSATNAIGIGRAAVADQVASIALGDSANTSAANQLMLGSSTAPINVIIGGSGDLSLLAPASQALILGSGGAEKAKFDGTSGRFQVNAGTGTDRAKVGGAIDYSTTQTGNVGTGEDILFTSTIVANTLSTNGDVITCFAGGTIATSVNNKRIRVRLGGVGGGILFDSGSQAITTAADWRVEGQLIRTGAATQKSVFSLSTSSTTLLAYADYATASQDLTTNLDLVVTAEATDNNDVVGEVFHVKWFPAP